MDLERARAVLAALQEQGRGFLSAEVIEALGVVLQTSPAAATSDAPAARVQVAASGVSGRVGFVGVLRLPEDVWLSEDGIWAPYEELDPALSWGRLLSWGGPGMVRPSEPGATWLQAYVRALLRGSWRVRPVSDPGELVLELGSSIQMTLPAHSDLLQTVDVGGVRHWEFRRGASTYNFLTILAHAATVAGVSPERGVACGEGSQESVPLPFYVAGIGDGWQTTLSDIPAYIRWTEWLADRIRMAAGEAVLRGRTPLPWDKLSGDDQEGWAFWVRNHPGMIRLELALRGFFANGGTDAAVSVCVSQEWAESGAADFLPGAFSEPVSVVCAPGLSRGWQEAVASWAAEVGVTAITEAPRYAFSEAPTGLFLGPSRWLEDESDYEGHPTVAAAPLPEERCGARGADGVGPWVYVDNPLAMGTFDAVRLSPPAGLFAAGAGAQPAGVHGPVVQDD